METSDEFKEAVSEYNRLKDEAAVLMEEASTYKAWIVETMQAAKVKSTTFKHDDASWKVTVVEGTSTTLDPEKLKKKVGSKVWTKLTSRTLDREKLERAIENDVVSPRTVAECSETTTNRPYPRITKKGG